MNPLHRRAAAAAAALAVGVVLTATGTQAHSTPAERTAVTAPADYGAVTALAAATVTDPGARVERLWVVDGDEQLVPAGQQVPVRLKLRALDHDHHPVAGATVLFSTPGPGLKFPDGDDDATAVTDADGYALAPALTALGTPGPDLVIASVSDRAQVAFEITVV
ncbi:MULTISPECIES: hypothetical protein [Kitasatospora]|uniref:Big-1 domain-containing protein n=1 Tax=Kitasatospora setae (strain ATCC 33774 / DSM 43861 / JCM 3304 / KCC A-0304 / NBRC 14216 / KM-6054) TaxID=452652 RepID=E4N461_KITSK|nr:MULTISPECIES: hypothetical protein [Kitasatospora]BAJ25992.1 hypothetical protein KSE_01410 [Kitasatospora setae KM-6054]